MDVVPEETMDIDRANYLGANRVENTLENIQIVREAVDPTARKKLLCQGSI